MSKSLSASAPEALQEYYRILTGGPAEFGTGDTLRPILSPHLDFTGSLAGHRPDSTEGFLHGVSGFIATVQSIDIVREVHDDTASAVLYDSTLPGGEVRFAEFFTFEGGVIATLDLHYDGQHYIASGGR
ncbi:hypothetical protein [Subtercola lobariae]|uniref:SnoaL-like domain-containing protein n=1 Tax=Subtercola lobariae TaxID=1588641 RepID=A0A917B115_9MICO|nr:hypothetical protein [Subtercola lobariae]GGF10692.1 hypothetical protein GCM10011399_00620 [Subtercola lobariae]